MGRPSPEAMQSRPLSGLISQLGAKAGMGPMSEGGINALQAPQGAMPQQGASQTYIPQQTIANANPAQLGQMPVNAQVSPQGTDTRKKANPMMAALAYALMNRR